METLMDGFVISGLGILWVFAFLTILVLIMKIFSAIVARLEKVKPERNAMVHRHLAAAAAWAKSQEDQQ